MQNSVFLDNKGKEQGLPCCITRTVSLMEYTISAGLTLTKAIPFKSVFIKETKIWQSQKIFVNMADE